MSREWVEESSRRKECVVKRDRIVKGLGRFGLVAAGAVLALALSGVAAASTSNAVSNGDFETGSLAPWTTFTTSNGTINGGDVQMFDTTGNGASYAAHFNVGEVNFISGDFEGGGIQQNFFGGGSYTVSADVAAYAPEGNYDCGDFELLVDGNAVASYNFGPGYPNTNACMTGETMRAHLSGTASVGLGWHQVRVLITRPWTTELGVTPDQYVDNVIVARKLTKVT
jgi:hypothetical protein